MTYQQKFIEVFGKDMWQQMIVFMGLADQFKEVWISPYKGEQPSEDCVKREDVKSGMIKYGFLAPDMTVTEFVEDCLPSVTPQLSEEDIHREREQAYMLGYEDASKKFRTELQQRREADKVADAQFKEMLQEVRE